MKKAKTTTKEEKEPKATKANKKSHPLWLASNDTEREKMAKQAEENAKLKRQLPNCRRENCDAVESRSRRVQLLVKPSIYDHLKKLADVECVSVNQIAERAFLRFIESFNMENQ